MRRPAITSSLQMRAVREDNQVNSASGHGPAEISHGPRLKRRFRLLYHVELCKTFSPFLPLFLGAAAFLLIIGPHVLRTDNIAWLQSHDPAASYLGWAFFRKSPLYFPLGLNPDYGLEISSSIVYSDSNPLLAIFFKLLANVLPETFQYFGMWLLLCFLLQSWFGWKISGLINSNQIYRLCVTGLFVIAPPMLWRVGGHLNLVGHFFILAGLFLCLSDSQRHRQLWWSLVLCGAALVHAYILVMVIGLWIADLFGRLLTHSIRGTAAACEVSLVIISGGIAMWQAGHVAVGISSLVLPHQGFGIHRMNLLSPFDASGWSYLLPSTNNDTRADYEGFNYLGLGFLVALFFALATIILGRVRPRVDKQHWPLIVVLTLLSLFALSNRVGLGTAELIIPLPGRLLKLANIVPSSARMFWPAYYALIFFVALVLARGYTKSTSIKIVAMVFLIQIVDTSAGWRMFQGPLWRTPSSRWATPLKSDFWHQAASRYKKIRVVPPTTVLSNWWVIPYYALGHGLTIDGVLLARIDQSKLPLAWQRGVIAVEQGRFEQDTLYIINREFLLKTALVHDPARDLLAEIDGYFVLAPGWRDCLDCATPQAFLNPAELLPHVRANEWLSFGSGGEGVKFLGIGWSYPEDWGTWTNGEYAEVILPLTSEMKDSKDIFIEAHPFVTRDHPRQRVDVWINGIFAEILIFEMANCNSVRRISIPSLSLEGAKRTGVIKLKFELKDAARPIEIGSDPDTRKLGIGLGALLVDRPL